MKQSDDPDTKEPVSAQASAPPTMTLQPGGFYVSIDCELWCCFRVDPDAAEHVRARCVRVSDGRIESFYGDGRYDAAGTREHTLLVEASFAYIEVVAGQLPIPEPGSAEPETSERAP